MNCENIILTYKARAEKMIRPRLIAFLVLFSAIFVFVLSGMYFLNLKNSDLINVNSYLLSSFLFTCIILIIVFFIVPFYNFNTFVFTDKQIKFSNSFFKNNNKEILYSDIKFFVVDSFFEQIAIKTTKNYYIIFFDKENKSKIIEILRSKILDLSETEKRQKQKKAQDKPFTILLIVIVGEVLSFSILPVTSFFYTVNADRHLQEFVKSNYTDKKSLDKAYNSYFATMNNKAFYNYKQMLKIEKYTKNEKFNENADYVKSLFPDKTKEIENIINSEKVDFLN